MDPPPPCPHTDGSVESGSGVGDFTVPRYLAVASVTVSLPLYLSDRISDTKMLQLCVWDWLLHAADEYDMVKKSKRPLSRIANCVYFIAR